MAISEFSNKREFLKSRQTVAINALKSKGWTQVGKAGRTKPADRS